MTLIQKMILDCVVVVVVVLRTHLGFHFQKKKLELPKTISKFISCGVKNGIKCHVIKKKKEKKKNGIAFNIMMLIHQTRPWRLMLAHLPTMWRIKHNQLLNHLN